jgi:large subunit ribosomal protein L13
MNQKTTVINPKDIKRSWHLIDASSDNLGRVCTQIAALLMGKGKVDFSYHQDPGDYVVVINASKIQVSGRKLKQKVYNSYSGHPGGLKSFTLQELLSRDSRRVIIHGVYGMLPKNKLRDARMTRLKVFATSEHTHSDKFTK